MKKLSLLPLLFCCLTTLVLSSQSNNDNPLDPPSPVANQNAEYVIVNTGPNECVWAKLAYVTNRVGRIHTITNAAYTEIATALSHSRDGKWVRSSEKWQLSEKGAEATNAAHSVFLAGNANGANAVDVLLPDGHRLVSCVLGLGYFDSASGRSVMIGEIKDCQGELLPSGREALYADAFSGVKADLLYVNQISGVEQFAILREQLPSPGEFGLNPITTRLELITEFTQAPEPEVSSQHVDGGLDERLNFGPMQMGRGYAFALGSETNKIRVKKEWLLMDGRRCLVEHVPFEQIARQLTELPVSSHEGANFRKPRRTAKVLAAQVSGEKGSKNHVLPGRKSPQLKATPFIAAKGPLRGKGFVMDYSLLSSQTNLVLKANTTYYVTSSVLVSSNLTIEGGCVVKFSSGQIALDSTNIVCRTAPYRPAIFTAVDDDTVGDQISGSTGTPSGTYGNGLSLIGGTVSNLRMSYCDPAFDIDGSLNFIDCQIVDCGAAFFAAGSATNFINLYNVLLNSVDLTFDTVGAAIVTSWQNVTLQDCGTMFLHLGGSDGSYIGLTNCLIFASSPGIGFPPGGTNSTVWLDDATGVFQTVGAGAHYLTEDSPYRNTGTAGIDPALLAGLKKKTTYPPLILTNGPSTADHVAGLTLSPCIQRDNDVPDLGYHYDPLDWLVFAYAVTNGTVTINPGTAIGYGDTIGLWVKGGVPIVSAGTPTSPSIFASFHTVQELSLKIGAGSPMPVSNNRSGGYPAAGQYYFTDFYRVAGGGFSAYNLYSDGSGWFYTSLEVENCQFFGGRVQIVGGSGQSFTATNNLFAIPYFVAWSDFPFVAYNNLFFRTVVDFEAGSTPYVLRNNAFDSGTFEDDIGDGPTTHEYNAFINNPITVFATDPTDLVLTNFVYESGRFGDFYQASTDLIDEGSTTANLVGLYHYTTQAVADDKELDSTVDIGFHYVGVDGDGNPKDSDEDGFPDYQEDANGNGALDSGETDWGLYSGSDHDLGLRVWITEPKRNSNVP